jgi:hypothetical protein
MRRYHKPSLTATPVSTTAAPTVTAHDFLAAVLLAPNFQEAISFLPLVESGHDRIHEWQVRPIAAEPLWRKQRRMWQRLCGGTGVELA